MRGLRSTIALAIILAGLSAYIYFVTNKKSDTDDSAAAKQEKVFPSFASDKVDELRVKSESGDTTTIKKDGGVWQVTSPITAKADDKEVGAMTSYLSGVSITRVVDAKPSDLKEYGLATPRVEVSFSAAGD